MLTFTDRQGHDIGDSNPQDANSVEILDDDLIIIHPAVEIPGVDTAMDPAEIAGVDPDFDVEPTGEDMDTDMWAMDTNVPVEKNAIRIVASNNKIQLRAPPRCPLLSQPLAQKR